MKRLNAIQNFGAMDVLCTDKTGTLTLDKIVLERHLDLYGEESDEALEFGYLNSRFQTGLKNLMDKAVLEHRDLEPTAAHYRIVDEIPFDFQRRRMSVVVSNGEGQRTVGVQGRGRGDAVDLRLCQGGRRDPADDRRDARRTSRR